MNRSKPPSHRRGAALFLVLIAMALSVVLATAFLDSRNSSVPIADGLDAASHVRRAANSGLELALASITSDFDWSSIAHDGVLARDLTIDHVDLSIDAIDLDTGEPPTNTTSTLKIRATATLNGVEIAAESIIHLQPEDAPLTLDFGEIALLAIENVRLSGDAILVPWLANPLRSGPADELLLGTLDGDPNRVHIEQNALTAHAVRLEVDPYATIALGGRRLLVDALPMLVLPPPPSPDVAARGDVVLGGEHVGDINAANVRIRAGAPLLIMGDSTIRSRGTFTIEPGAEIVVEEGTLTLDAEDAFEITGADLRAAPHTHLSIIARTTLTIRDSVIAPTGVDPNPLGLTPPEAQRATLIIRDAGDGAPSIVLTGTSRVMATVLAPNANVQIGGHTVLYGRVFASRIHAFDDAAIFALPDDGSSIGLSSAYGPHRDEDGHLRDEVTVANRTAPAAMDAIVAALDVPVASAGITIEPNWNETTASSRVVRRAARRAQREAQRHGRRDHRRRWTRRHWSGA